MIVESWILLSFCALIFCVGLLGVLLRRNLLVILMSIELMLNAINLTFVSFSYQLQDIHGQVCVFFVIALAASESAVGLALVIAWFRTMKTTDTYAMQYLRESP
jgi:NADH-quinone oxidoreductase subunit K